MRVSVGRCCLSLLDATYSTCSNLCWSCFSLVYVNVAQPMHTPHKLRVHAFDDSACCILMLVPRCMQTKLDACRSWLMVLVIWWCHLDKTVKWRLMFPMRCTKSMTNVRTPWLMFPSICRCILATKCKLGLMSISWCTHAMTDACRP